MTPQLLAGYAETIRKETREELAALIERSAKALEAEFKNSKQESDVMIAAGICGAFEILAEYIRAIPPGPLKKDAAL